MKRPLNDRRTELRLPCDRPEPRPLILERMPPRRRGHRFNPLFALMLGVLFVTGVAGLTRLALALFAVGR
jgi:hypothetical protein